MRPLFNVFPQQLPDPAKILKKYINQNIYNFMFLLCRYLGLQKTRDYHGTVEFKLGGEIHF